MINSDDENDVYPLFNDTVCKTVLLDSSQAPMTPTVSDSSWIGINNESFDSSAFLCSSTSDDIANYNFLEPLMPITMPDDGVTCELEVATSSASSYIPPIVTVSDSSCRSSYHFDPVSLSIVRCVVSNPQPIVASETHISAVTFDKNVCDQQHVNTTDELDTLDITKRVSEELRRCNISQALFAEAVLGRSQGTLSDLLRKPKPWAQLKSGRETFVKMQQWLLEPEKQRLSSLNIIDESHHNADNG